MRSFIAFLRYLLALISAFIALFAGFQFLLVILLGLVELYKRIDYKKPKPFVPKVITSTSKTGWLDKD
jgi:hypothetical protein